MTILVLGLVLFFSVHSIRIVADGWRSVQVARMGLSTWKSLFALLSIAGFVLMVWGYGMARVSAPELWPLPGWLRYVSALLTLVTFILWAAAYVPRNRIQAALGHPMVVGVKVWALAHLLSNARLIDLLVFGAFLVWSVLSFRAARQRDRASPPPPVAGTLGNTVIAVVIGAVAWAMFARYLHPLLIGVAVV
jgi:uncharacterized membrane protein